MFKVKKGFTVIEAVIAIVVIIILGGIVWFKMRAGADTLVINTNSKMAIKNVTLNDAIGKPFSNIPQLKPGDKFYVNYDVYLLTSQLSPSTTYQPYSQLDAISPMDNNKSLYMIRAKENKRIISDAYTVIKYKAEVATYPNTTSYLSYNIFITAYNPGGSSNGLAPASVSYPASAPMFTVQANQ